MRLSVTGSSPSTTSSRSPTWQWVAVSSLSKAEGWSTVRLGHVLIRRPWWALGAGRSPGRAAGRSPRPRFLSLWTDTQKRGGRAPTLLLLQFKRMYAPHT